MGYADKSPALIHRMGGTLHPTLYFTRNDGGLNSALHCSEKTA